MGSMKGASLLFVAAAAAMAAPAAQAGQIVNGGFETGDLTGWSSTAHHVSAVQQAVELNVGSAVWYATEGQYFARLVTDGPGIYTLLSQSFAATAGDTLSFDYFFDWGDYEPFYDNAYGRILDVGAGGAVATLFHWNIPGSYLPSDYGNVGWTALDYTFSQGGTYCVEFGIVNVLDSWNDSQMGVDSVKMVSGAVPEPLTWLAMTLGVGGIGAYLGKRKLA